MIDGFERLVEIFVDLRGFEPRQSSANREQEAGPGGRFVQAAGELARFAEKTFRRSRFAALGQGLGHIGVKHGLAVFGLDFTQVFAPTFQVGGAAGRFGQVIALADLMRHILLPALALALPLAATLTRVLKGSLIEAMNQDYVTLVRVKGYSRARTLWRVALRNALIPTVTLTGVQFSFLIGGTVLIEYIFSYPGIGNLAIAAVNQRDLPLIQGLVLTFAVLFILTNLVVDMAYSILNPKVRQS